jgi:penicillin amidase
MSGLRKIPNMGYGASNNWVVHGNHTKSGMPLLCNDPHLRLQAPSLWVLNGLHVKNSSFSHSVVGSSFPGVPSVVLGHNEHIAWGVTNT